MDTKSIFNFKVNDEYLLMYTIYGFREYKENNRPLPFSYWKSFDRKLREKFDYNEAYNLMFRGRDHRDRRDYRDWAIMSYFLKKNTEKELDLNKEFDQVLRKIKEMSESKRIIRETEESKERLKALWHKNQSMVLGQLQNITLLKIPRSPVDVYVVHPKILCGISFPEIRGISWGERYDWGNESFYNEVYLCHELLHILTNSKMKNGVLMHAIIELATDNELRIRLDKKGKYLEKHGHPYLRGLEKILLPYWKEFIKTKENLFDFEKKMLAVPEIKQELGKQNSPEC